jgi:Fic family protein
LFLIQEELLTLPILYLSRYIITHKEDYYRLLLEVTRASSWEPWVLFILQGVAETAVWTTKKIAAIRALQVATTAHVKIAAPKIYSHELIELIFELPYSRIHNVIERGLAARQAASRHLKNLVRVGVLEEAVSGREKLFIHPRLMKLLTRDGNEFAPYPTAA